MCFSAGASFGVSAILLAGGVIAIKKVQTSSQMPFALIPLIFSIQQFTEGIVWLSLMNSNYAGWHTISTNVFLTFAQVVWPAWVPLSIWMLEQDPKRKRILQFLLYSGIVVSMYMAYSMLFYPMHSMISRHHIRYDVDFPYHFLWFGGIYYFLSTVGPTFVSSIKKMPVIGGIILVSFIVSKLFFQEYAISIWCFFAAAISIMVLSIITTFQTSPKDVAKLRV
jgi:hypothetical protein